MSAEVVRLVRYYKKGEPGKAVSEAILLEGIGMEGNIHQGGERQLCLLSAEARRWMEAQEEQGLCFKRFKENILIEGLPFSELSAGSLLAVGDSVLRLSSCGKLCFDDCALFSSGAPCLLSDGAVFAVVERGGSVRIGDVVSK